MFRMVKSRRLRWEGHLARMKEGMTDFKVLVGKHSGKIPLRMHRRRWVASTRLNLKYICVNTRNWVQSAQDSNYWRDLVNSALNL